MGAAFGTVDGTRARGWRGFLRRRPSQRIEAPHGKALDHATVRADFCRSGKDTQAQLLPVAPVRESALSVTVAAVRDCAGAVIEPQRYWLVRGTLHGAAVETVGRQLLPVLIPTTGIVREHRF